MDREVAVIKAQLFQAVLCLLLLAAIAGCVANGGGGTAKEETLSLKSRELSAIYDRLTDFADDYVTKVSELYTKILRDDRTKIDVRREAIRAWLAAVRAAYINVTDDNPLDGLINMTILVRVQNHAYAQPWFDQTFGPSHAQTARAMMADEEQRVWSFAGNYLTTKQTDELRGGIDQWLEKHPTPNAVSLIRLGDLREARGSDGKSPPGSIFSLAFLDPMAPTVRELQRTRLAANRIFYYAQRWPIVLRLEAELMWADLLSEPTVTNTLENANQNAAALLDISRKFYEQFAKLPANVATERQTIIDQFRDVLAAQREATIKEIAEATAHEREAIITRVSEATARERSAAIEQLSSNIDRVGHDLIDRIAQATAKERETALRDAGSTVNQSQHKVWEDFDAVNKIFVERLVIGLCLAALIIAVMVALVMLGYHWLIHRMPPGSGTVA